MRSLVPFREPGTLMQPDFGLLGLQREIDRLFNEVAQGVGHSGAQLVPKIDVSENDKTIEISAEMPGLERKDVEILIDDDMLTIRGEKKIEKDKTDENVQHSERSYGVFLRVLQLPLGIDPSGVQTTMSNGVLKISIPKPAKPEPKKIEVKEGNDQTKQAA
ncbi:Hsp20/alpha crystallin family protein [Bradyrhizobium sp. USDA 4471]